MVGDTDSPLPALWDMDSADYECDCPGPPPPVFKLPPPPRPPFLHELADCSEAPLLDLETCDAMPVIIPTPCLLRIQCIVITWLDCLLTHLNACLLVVVVRNWNTEIN